MKLLIISHPCVTPINQQFYAEIEKQTGWELIIITPSKWKTEYKKRYVLKKWPEFKGKLIGIPVFKRGDIPLHIYKTTFISLFKKINPDVIYVHHEPYALATFQIYLANILSIKRPTGFYSAQNIKKKYPFPFRQGEQMIFSQSQFAFPVSLSAEQVLKEKGYKNKSILLPLSIDPKIYYPIKNKKKTKDQFCKNRKEILIGYLGRIVEEKGLKTLLLALSKIKQLPYKLAVIGSGPYEKKFDILVKKLYLTEKVKRLNYVPHPKAPIYLSAFDIFVLPSETKKNLKEQFGRVIIESLACGTPVIGSDSGEIPYLINATEGGLIFQEKNANELAEKIKKLIINPNLRKKLAKKGREKVLKEYTHASVAKKFIKIIKKVVNNT